MTSSRIPLLLPDMPLAEELLPWLKRIDATRWYSNFGPLVRELESALIGMFAERSDKSLHLTTVSNCTAGLELALLALDLKPGSRVLVPALTFVATATAVLRAGHLPVIADVDPHTWLLTPAIARAALAREALDAILPVATFSCPHEIEGWNAFIAETGLPVVIDAAAAFGNQWECGRTTLVFSSRTVRFSLGHRGRATRTGCRSWTAPPTTARPGSARTRSPCRRSSIRFSPRYSRRRTGRSSRSCAPATRA